MARAAVIPTFVCYKASCGDTVEGCVLVVKRNALPVSSRSSWTSSLLCLRSAVRSKFIPLDQHRARDCNLKLNYCRGISRSLIYFQEHFHRLGTLDGWRRVMVDFWSSNEGYCQPPPAFPDLLTMWYRNCVSDNNGYYWAGEGEGRGLAENCSLCNSHRSVRKKNTCLNSRIFPLLLTFH